MKSRRLLRRPRPYPDESLAGYIIRLTETNYYSSSKWIFKMSGLRARGIYANVFNHEKDDLSGLSNISDVEAGILWSMAFPGITFNYSKVVKRAKVFGNVIPTDAINHNQVQLCPICLQEEPYYRLIWGLSVVSACPLHHCLLIDRCPQCQLQILWSRPSVVLCSCQFDWRKSRPVIVESEQIALSRYIYKMCHLDGLLPEEDFSISLDNPVSQLNLGSLVNLLFSILKFCRFPGIRHQVFPPKGTSSELSLNLESEFERVFALCKNWPYGFCQLMDRYEAYLGYVASDWCGSTLLVRDILIFFQSTFVLFDLDDWIFLQELFADYFERFLKTISLKNIQISFFKDFRIHSVCISLITQPCLTKKLASMSELEGLTLAKLFSTSQIDMYNETLFFRMAYFPN